MEYMPRTLDLMLDELMGYEAAIAIDGPKGVGKTATAARRATKIWRADIDAERATLEADPLFEDAPNGTLLVDEWQRLPTIWDSVRRQVDDGAGPGRFLLTGSATPRRGTDTHSGAGRIESLRMRPMAFYERHPEESTLSLSELLNGVAGSISGTTVCTAAGYFESIVRSGFPDIFRLPERQSTRRLEAYLQRVIDRDMAEQGYAVRRPETLRRWLAAYAAASSSSASYSNILDATTSGDGSQPARSTTIAYRDQLTQLWLLDPVPAWTPRMNNPFKWLQNSSKHQLADPALAARLLGLSSSALGSSQGAAMAGPLFESLATLSVRVAADAAGARVGHLRTKGGEHEIDLVVEGFNGEVVGIEVKLSAHVDDKHVKHLKWFKRQLGDRVADLIVLYTGKEAYRRRDGVAVIPLALLSS
ncbi:hypothetical protein SAMN04489751_2104 [Brevibacterium sandarakinum]|uniref:AAA+ ATPase domain-containing protein n=1 Tax=Brevibacterium sandarakinum TaxID=629680 RepID=A0A1H1SHX7_BRESA|nr:DUF4143 domain-containing protein [Brevibacterium sandarakinum]SDS47585.1 hypothetical protein SAMN04489751_2104 [Brevibacterium sandarakinum]